MLQKFMDRYEDSEYFITANRKEIARENILACGDFIVFSSFLYLIFLVYSGIFDADAERLLLYFIPVPVLLILRVLFNKISPKVSDDFYKVRYFAMAIYTTIFTVGCCLDAIINVDSRSFLMPAAILISSALYMDFFAQVMLHKLLLGLVFLVVESVVKGSYTLPGNFFLVLMAILTAGFCYFVVMSLGLSRREDNRALEQKSITDLLTGLLNKMSFEEKCKDYLNCRVAGAKATMFIIDVDNFKHVNDNYGHQVGDEVLKNFARILKSYFHATDIIGRVGGDEFMILVMGELPKEFIDKRCRDILHEFRTSRVEDAGGFTCSIGICEDVYQHSFEEMYNMADSALYEAKNGGKARHVLKSFE